MANSLDAVVLAECSKEDRMSVIAPVLSGAQGELISLSFTVDSKHLEDLLEALASVSFPVNPQLYHRPLAVTVEFPAYSSGIAEVRSSLARFGFPAEELKVTRASQNPHS